MERNPTHATFDPSLDDSGDIARLRQIETAFDEVAALAKSEMSRGRFAERFLHYAVRAASAVGGAVWEFSERGEPVATESLDFDCLRLDSETEAEHGALVQQAFVTARGAVVLPHSMTDSIGTATNPTDYTLVLVPLMLTERAVAVLELILSGDTDSREQRAAVEVAESLAELASEFYLRDSLRRDTGYEQLLKDFDVFVRHIHRSVRLDETAHAIVNQGRRFLNCDRLSLVLADARKCTVQAVSSVETINRRSNAVRLLTDLVERLIPRGGTSYTFDEAKRADADIQPRLDAYLEESAAKQLAVVPLVAPSERTAGSASQPIGALVVESFQETLPPSIRPRVELIREHCAQAVQNSLLARRSAIGRWLRPKRVSRIAATLAVLASVVAALVLVPADFTIEARGRLQPLERRDIFAPSPGVVREIHVGHSQKVAVNDTLIVLENPALELEYERVRGELQTVRERLSALEATRGTQSKSDGKDREMSLVIAQVEELRERLANLENQRRLIETQREQLVLKSPLAGEVITWKPDEILRDRPVERGQRLVTVAAPHGPWVLELLVPDGSVGHILDAQQELGNDLDVTYILATDPSKTFSSKLRSVASSAEIHDDHQPYVLATVDLKGDEVPAKRPGATVVAKVQCGRRSLGYVWLRELFETVQRHFFL